MDKTLIRSLISKTAFVLAATFVCLFALFEISSRNVHICCDLRESEFVTFLKDTKSILSKAGTDVSEDDIIERSDEGKRININVFKAHDVTIVDGGESLIVRAAGKVSDALKKAKITLGKNDRISAPESTLITSDFKVVIDRAFAVLIKVDGKKIISDVTDGTVRNLLREKGIVLGEKDSVSPPLEETLRKGMKIVIKRIKYKVAVITEEIPFEKETIFSDEMFTDESELRQEGENGVRKIYYLKKYVDGKLKKKTVVARLTEKEAKKEITVRGTKIHIVPVDSEKTPISELTPPFEISLDENGRPLNYKKLIVGEATAYSGGTVCSTGVSAMPGRVAVDPREIPYGTQMYIISTDGKYVYGYSVAADTGGFIYTSDTVVDLRFNEESDCERFGRRDVEIYILE